MTYNFCPKYGSFKRNLCSLAYVSLDMSIGCMSKEKGVCLKISTVWLGEKTFEESNPQEVEDESEKDRKECFKITTKKHMLSIINILYFPAKI